MNECRLFAGVDFLDSIEKNYPELLSDQKNHFGFLADWHRHRAYLNTEPTSSRFVSIKDRAFTMQRNSWDMAKRYDLKWIAARLTYKGLINLKPPTDLVLYSNLVWELQPKTIIEFGTLQGGSALWFFDQLQLNCGGGEVHSFDKLTNLIHPRAKSSQIHFHKVDLFNPESLDRDLFKSLPHPWLVVDDAHCNLENIVPIVSKYMVEGDYYIWEDYFHSERLAFVDSIKSMSEVADKMNLLVDTKYTDAFGYNVTCSPNGWLRKMKE